MTDYAPSGAEKSEFLELYGYTPGTPEAEQIWADKCRMDRGEFQAPMGFVSMNICYDSPIDGRPITTKQARIEDLKRSGCVEYDPGMKEQAAQYRQASQDKLEAAVGETIEREISLMPTAKKERLHNELAGGAEIALDRTTT